MIFISYRRTDTTSGYASWIYDKLAEVVRRRAGLYGHGLAAIGLGIDFVEHLKRALDATDIALILIGPGWLDAKDDSGNRRLDDLDDFVRVEVAAALRTSARIIPVLVDGARMPHSSLLPEDLRSTTRRQALTFQRHAVRQSASSSPRSTRRPTNAASRASRRPDHFKRANRSGRKRPAASGDTAVEHGGRDAICRGHKRTERDAKPIPGVELAHAVALLVNEARIVTEAEAHQRTARTWRRTGPAITAALIRVIEQVIDQGVI